MTSLIVEYTIITIVLCIEIFHVSGVDGGADTKFKGIELGDMDGFIMNVDHNTSMVGSCASPLEQHSFFSEIESNVYQRDFMKWLCENGFKDREYIKVREISNAGLGVVANVDLTIETPLFSIPTNLFLYPTAPLLRLKTVHAIAVAGGALRAPGFVSPAYELTSSVLAVMMERRNPNSFYRPFLDLLRYPASPHTFPESVRKEFTPLLNKFVDLHVRRALTNWRYLRTLPFFKKLAKEPRREFPDHSKWPYPYIDDLDSEFLWAAHQIIQRSYNYGPDNRREYVLIPCIELFNHVDTVKNRYFYTKDFLNESTKEAIVVEATADTLKGEQLFHKYSNSSNMKLFLQYGFVLPYNNKDFLVFSVRPKGTAMKEAVRKRFKVDTYEFAMDRRGIRMNDLVVMTSILAHKLVDEWNGEIVRTALQYLLKDISKEVFPGKTETEDDAFLTRCRSDSTAECDEFYRSYTQFRQYVRGFVFDVRQSINVQIGHTYNNKFKKLDEVDPKPGDIPLTIVNITVPDVPISIPSRKTAQRDGAKKIDL